MEQFDPNKNPNVISLVKQEDGNWKGYTQKTGQLLEVRQISPQVVLDMLLTHP